MSLFSCGSVVKPRDPQSPSIIDIVTCHSLWSIQASLTREAFFLQALQCLSLLAMGGWVESNLMMEVTRLTGQLVSV